MVFSRSKSVFRIVCAVSDRHHEVAVCDVIERLPRLMRILPNARAANVFRSANSLLEQIIPKKCKDQLLQLQVCAVRKAINLLEPGAAIR